jgi:hypothetical protein
MDHIEFLEMRQGCLENLLVLTDQFLDQWQVLLQKLLHIFELSCLPEVVPKVQSQPPPPPRQNPPPPPPRQGRDPQPSRQGRAPPPPPPPVLVYSAEASTSNTVSIEPVGVPQALVVPETVGE